MTSFILEMESKRFRSKDFSGVCLGTSRKYPLEFPYMIRSSIESALHLASGLLLAQMLSAIAAFAV